jgi:hypothetical protein
MTTLSAQCTACLGRQPYHSRGCQRGQPHERTGLQVSPHDVHQSWLPVTHMAAVVQSGSRSCPHHAEPSKLTTFLAMWPRSSWQVLVLTVSTGPPTR